MVDPASDYPDGCPECGCAVYVELERQARFRTPDRWAWVARCAEPACGWSMEESPDADDEPDVEDGPDQDGGGA